MLLHNTPSNLDNIRLTNILIKEHPDDFLLGGNTS